MKKMTLDKVVCCLLALVILLTGCGNKNDDVVIEFTNHDAVTATISTEYLVEETLIEEGSVELTENILPDEEVLTQMTCDVDVRKFYYEQLNDIEKEIYDSLMNSKEQFIENEEILCYSYSAEKGYDRIYEEYATRAFFAYLYDNPMATMWVNSLTFKTGVTSVYVDGEYSHLASVDLYIIPQDNIGRYGDFATPDETRKAIVEVEKEVASFVETLTGTEEEKYIKIHDWLIDGAEYDETGTVSNLRSVYGAIVQKNCVCAGYAYAYKYVADMADLNVLYVHGLGDGGAHAWNHVFVNGEWKLVDVTWDVNPIMVSYETGVTTEEYINEEGMLVVEYTYEYDYREEVNHTYLFLDIVEQVKNGEHIHDTELGFSYKS